MVLITTLTIIGLFSLAVLFIGFFLQPCNPYLIIIGSVTLLVGSMGVLADGIEQEGATVAINSTKVGNFTQATITQVPTEIVDSRMVYLSIIFILTALYTTWFGISEIIIQKDGEATIN